MVGIFHISAARTTEQPYVPLQLKTTLNPLYTKIYLRSFGSMLFSFILTRRVSKQNLLAYLPLQLKTILHPLAILRYSGTGPVTCYIISSWETHDHLKHPENNTFL